MKKRLISACILIVYSAILIKLIVFKDVPMIRIGPLMFRFGGTRDGPANLVPFKTILPYLFGEKGFVIGFLNLAGNVVLFVPIGFLVPFIFQNTTWKKSLAVAVAAGVTIEGMQEVLHVGIFDIDDVILNGLGVMVGYWAFIIFTKKMRTMKRKNVIITAVVIVAAVAAAAFYEVAANKTSQQPVRVSPGAESSQPDSTVRSDSSKPGTTARLDTGKAGIPEGLDPCKGTGGTGQIVSVRNDTMTITRNDGKNEIIYLTDKTTIRNSAGALSPSDLKTGDRVTVVVMSKHTATVVLVCSAGRPHPGDGGGG